jgi:ribonucleoside-diphosphate reductase alpha chain
MTERYVTKRNGSRQFVDREKMKRAVLNLCRKEKGNGTKPINLDYVNVDMLIDKTMEGMGNVDMTTEKLHSLLVEQCASMACRYPDYSLLAGRIYMTGIYKKTNGNMLDLWSTFTRYKDSRSKRETPLVRREAFDFVEKYWDCISSLLDQSKDFDFDLDYFAIKTLERTYLLRMDRRVAERPQFLMMRCAVGIHYRHDDIDAVLETYRLLSDGFFVHASPTLFNAATYHDQLSSCFIVPMTKKEDSIEGIYDTLKTCALISKSAGGIGLNVHDIRAKDSYIAGTDGVSNGLIPMLKVYDTTVRYVDQGGGKRKGAFCVYSEPWHADMFDFLQLRKNNGKEEMRARDLFTALWVPDLFMKRVEADADWSLFSPNEAPGLADVWGVEFETLFEKYEKEGRAMKTIKARDLWTSILDSQIETGGPFICYKDSCNRKSNHNHLGTIRSSNLCTEIMEYHNDDEVAVCNLASLALPKYVVSDMNSKTELLKFDFEELARVTKRITKNLDRIIDVNHYPVVQAERSNKRHRPIGIGVQGLADVFAMLHMPFGCQESRRLNKEIFETIYYAALEASVELAMVAGPHDSYEGSPVSRGILQFDMWDNDATNTNTKTEFSGRWDWASLKARIAAHGVRNSLLLAPMPTASTSQILGNNECFETVYIECVFASRSFRRIPHCQQTSCERPHQTQHVEQRHLRENRRRQWKHPVHCIHPPRIFANCTRQISKFTACRYRHGGRSWKVYRSKPEPQHLPCKSKLFSTHFDAFLRMESRVENWHVLSSQLAGCRRNQGHPGRQSCPHCFGRRRRQDCFSCLFPSSGQRTLPICVLDSRQQR